MIRSGWSLRFSGMESAKRDRSGRLLCLQAIIKLNNLIAIIDRNNLSATDFTENYITLEPLQLRWQAFGWEVVTVNGHSFEQLIDVLSRARKRSASKPLVIIADTVKGKGVSFMENSSLWHHQLPKGKEAVKAREELLGSKKKIDENCFSDG